MDPSDLAQLFMQNLRSHDVVNYSQADQLTKDKYTNKKFLIEAHDAQLRQHENMPSMYQFQMTTTTTSLKSSAPVSLHAKNCIAIIDLLKSIDEPIIGKFLLCRSICPPTKMTALAIVVDDPDSKLGVRVSLYNFVRNTNIYRPKDVYQYLPVGTILAVMNPWFKRTVDKGLSVRCDNPAEVVILTQSKAKEILKNLTWKGDIPTKYRPKELMAGDSSVNWKVSGNEHFVQKRFHNAIEAYTSGIDNEKGCGKIKLELLANRSAAYLALHKHTKSLEDAESVLTVDKNHIKCIYRKTKCLHGLAQYSDALQFLRSKSQDALPKQHQTIISDLIVKTNSLIVQSQTGEYPWMEIFQNKFDELAEFVGPVLVKNTLTKGRGLFATDAIKAGQLLLASKAFAYVVDDSTNFLFNLNIDEASGRKSLNDRSQTQLVSEIVHILKENPEKMEGLYKLYAGPEFSCSRNEPFESHGRDIDMKRIKAICSYNQFGNGNFFIPGKERDCGVWLSPSFINHSCVDANCTWYYRKDFLFVFAFHDIAEGEEILISYVLPLENKLKDMLQHQGFVCQCRLCIRNSLDDVTIQNKRSKLISSLDEILTKYGDGSSLDIISCDIENDDVKMTKILESLENLRADAPELNLSYADKLHSVANIYFRNGNAFKSSIVLESMYKLLANIPVFSMELPKISANIIGTYLALRQIDKAMEWIRVLKRDVSLAYGTWKVIEVLFPCTFKVIENLGITLSEM